MKEYDPLTPSEVNDAAKEFFPLFDIVHRNMPENCTVEDTIKAVSYTHLTLPTIRSV